MGSSGNRHLPEDLMIDIFLRLPVKSLLQTKSVCKYWYSVIKSPDFMNKHFHHYNNHSRLLVHHYCPHKNKYAFALFPDETLISASPLHQDLDYLYLSTNLKVLGPVNGFFVLYNDFNAFPPRPRNDFRVAMWNPSTRELWPLPVLNSNLPPNITVSMEYVGFGLDPLTNDLKLVLIQYYSDRSTYRRYGSPVVAVYTLGTDSWRHIDHAFTFNLEETSSCTTYVNGAYYWLASTSYPNFSIVIFDFGSEVFREVEAPDNPESKFGELLVLNDSIALLLSEISGSDLEFMDNPEADVDLIDIWVMKGDGCWTKLLTVGPLLQLDQLLGFWKNDELFFETTTSELAMCNLLTNQTMYLGINGIEVFSYKESLFSIKGGNKAWEHDNLSASLQDFLSYQPQTAKEEINCFPFISHVLDCLSVLFIG